jgi:HSP20 family protein
MRHELEQSFRRLLPEVPWSFGGPAADVSRTDEAIVIKLDLPGMSVDDVQIDLDDRTLTVSGSRSDDKEERHEGYYRRERAFGDFARTFWLPLAADAEHVGAEFDNGVLRITVPLVKAAEPKRIEVKEKAVV